MEWNVPVPPQHFGRGVSNPNIFPVDDDYNQAGNAGLYRGNDDLDGLDGLLGGVKIGGAKTGKNKNKGKLVIDDEKKEKKPRKPVEVLYEGYALSKLTPPRGEKPTWSKVGKRLLPVDSDTLTAKAIQHQKATGLDILAQIQRLSPDQQGIITRLLAEKNLREKDVNADWIVYDVKKLEKDVEVSFWRMGRTVTALRVIIKRQDKLPSSAKKPNTAADYEFGEIIDLSVPLQVNKESKDGKEGKEGKDGNNNTKDKKKTKKDNVVSDFDDNILDSIINDAPPPDQYRQNHHARPQQEYAVDPFANQGPQYHEQHHQQQHQQPQQFQEFYQPQQHHQNDGHHGDPFAGVPHGAIPIPQDHQQHQQYDHPPHAPMPPHANPFQPEVGVAAQYDMPPQMNQFYPQQESAYGPARITTRDRSQSRARQELERQLERERQQLDREREENERLRAASRNRRDREAEDRLARSRSRQRRDSEERRRNQEEIRRIRNEVASVKDKVTHWQDAPSSSSATSGEEFWDASRAGYSTPGTSPDRDRNNPRRGSLHRRKSSDPRQPKYYQDRRSRYPGEPADIIPAYTTRRDYDRGRRLPSDVGFSPPPRPRVVQTHSYDDYPRSGVRHVEPRYLPQTRRLTDFSEAYPDAGFDRRGGGTDFLRQDPRRRSRQYEGGYEPMYDERRGGGRERRNSVYI